MRGLATVALLCALACRGTKPPDKELVAAVMAGDVDTARKLLERGANVHAVDNVYTGKKAVCLAASRGSSEMMELMFEHGASKSGSVYCAAGRGNAPTLRAALAAGAMPDDVDASEKGLALACEDCNLEVVELLIEAGANLDGGGPPGTVFTPMGVAAQGGHTECVRRVLKAGATVDYMDKLGHTALAHSVIGGDIDSVRLLLDAGANPLLPNRAGHTPAFISAFRDDRAEIQQLFRDRGVTNFDMQTPPKLPGGGPLVRVPALEVQAR